MKYFSWMLISLFLGLIIVIPHFSRSSFYQHQLLAFSLSTGDSYYGRLQLWYDFARVGDWDNAARLEKYLDPVDISEYKKTNQPSELKKYLNTLSVKPDKNIEDWLELARVNAILGRKEEITETLKKARSIDPIRDDITYLYYQSLK